MTFAPGNCEKPATKHSIEKPILRNVVYGLLSKTVGIAICSIIGVINANVTLAAMLKLNDRWKQDGKESVHS